MYVCHVCMYVSVCLLLSKARSAEDLDFSGTYLFRNTGIIALFAGVPSRHARQGRSFRRHVLHTVHGCQAWFRALVLPNDVIRRSHSTYKVTK